MGFFMNNIYIYIYKGKPETVCNSLSKQYLKNWKKVENFFFLKKEVFVLILSEFNPTCE